MERHCPQCGSCFAPATEQQRFCTRRCYDSDLNARARTIAMVDDPHNLRLISPIASTDIVAIAG